MSVAITLDPEKMARFEPDEVIGRSRSFIALADVPSQMLLTGQPPQIIAIDFGYRLEAQRPVRLPLDNLDDPTIIVTYEASSKRIRKLQFSSSIKLGDLAGIADRIDSQSQRPSLRLSTRYNHRMVASILRNYPDFLEDLSSRGEFQLPRIPDYM